MGFRMYSDTLFDGYVQKKLDLEPGTNYLVEFYNTAVNPLDNQNDTYNIWMGWPFIKMKKLRLSYL